MSTERGKRVAERLTGSAPTLNPRGFTPLASMQQQGVPGRVAQLVEQGTENPRVGGSIPPPATTSRQRTAHRAPSPLGALLTVLLSGCGADPCRTLCLDATTAMAGCLGEWGYTWEDLGAASKADYRSTCLEQWDTTRVTLETRQVSEAQDRCTAADSDLDTLSCAEIWALFH